MRPANQLGHIMLIIKTAGKQYGCQHLLHLLLGCLNTHGSLFDYCMPAWLLSITGGC